MRKLFRLRMFFLSFLALSFSLPFLSAENDEDLTCLSYCSDDYEECIYGTGAYYRKIEEKELMEGESAFYTLRDKKYKVELNLVQGSEVMFTVNDLFTYRLGDGGNVQTGENVQFSAYEIRNDGVNDYVVIAISELVAGQDKKSEAVCHDILKQCSSSCSGNKYNDIKQDDDWNYQCKEEELERCAEERVMSDKEKWYCANLLTRCKFQNKGNTMVCSNGCLYQGEGTCIPYGTRATVDGLPSYCDIDGVIKVQKDDSEPADNNYECVSNSARYGVCEPVAEQVGLLRKMFGWISRFFGGGYLT